ncbi:MAG: N-6 DNA methylase [Thermodesulfovibrionales bacterium]|nr:N-6 DNA methylase [Thermodesulfovibrionales bacterium]
MNSKNRLTKNKEFDYLIQFLGFADNDNFFFLKDKKDKLKKFPVRLQTVLKEKLKIDAVYVFNNKPVVLFKFFDDCDNEKLRKFHRNIWNLNESPVAFAILPNEIRMYNAYIFSEEEKGILYRIVDQIKENDKIYLSKFSSFNVDSGKIWEEFGDEFNKKNRVDNKLLENLKAARKVLREGEDKLSYRTIHSIVGRCIFSRYLIDREAIAKDFFRKNYSVKSFDELILNKKKLYNFFDFLKERFNGDLFPIDKEEEKTVTSEHLRTMNRLFRGDVISTGQMSLFQEYDFSIIPIELISNIYETFLTQEDPDEKRKSGVFYTPIVLVDYILSRSLNSIIEKKNDYNITILDPACGSGVFLVESFRRMVEKYIEKKRKISPEDFKRKLTDIAVKNIFGIDKSLDSIRVAAFSLYIAMLDYIKPRDIRKNGFEFPCLIYDENNKTSGKNFFKADFFDAAAIFNKEIIFKGKKFDLILGNPPWGIPKGENHPYEIYCNDQKPPIPISRRQIAEAFLVRASDFAKEDTEIALIVTSKILYNLNDKDFRKYFLSNFLITEVLEFSSVRTIMFNEAIGPGAIIFYKKGEGKKIENNEISYYALKPNLFSEKLRIIAAEGSEVKIIAQKYFIDYDYLWKIMLNGNILDFYFFKRMKGKENYSTMATFLKENNLIMGRGFEKGMGMNPIRPELKDLQVVTTKNNKNTGEKDIFSPFFINFKKAPRIKDLYENVEFKDQGIVACYKGPHLLIKKGTFVKNRLVLAFLDEDAAFKNSVYGIANESDGNKKDLYYYLNGLIYSKLFVYQLFHSSAIWGIERDNFAKEEIENLSMPDSNGISSSLKNINSLVSKIIIATKNNDIASLQDSEKKLDALAYKIFDIDNIEKDLIDYTFDISIPLFNNKKDPLKPPTTKELESYAQIFIDGYKDIFEKQGKSFQVEIYTGDRYFVAMNFKVLNKIPDQYIISKNEPDINKIVKLLGYASFEKISQRLYVRRSMTGYDKNSFFIIKPNERKSWHKANARHDVNEFISAMWKNDIRRIGEKKTAR